MPSRHNQRRFLWIKLRETKPGLQFDLQLLLSGYGLQLIEVDTEPVHICLFWSTSVRCTLVLKISIDKVNRLGHNHAFYQTGDKHSIESYFNENAGRLQLDASLL